MTSVESQTLPETPDIARRPGDAFLWQYPLIALGCQVALATLAYLGRIGGVWLILSALLLIVIVFAMVFVTMFGISALVDRRFKRAAAVLLAPVILISPLLLPILPVEYAALDLMRLYYNKGTYDSTAAKLAPADRALKVVFFDWGGEGFMLAPTEYSLVYDESGEIALPDEVRSRAWRDRVYPQLHWNEDQCVISARHLVGHYYSVAMHCSD
jgi:heme/copper-type cytochrome/quinol oxidase subunit 2